MQGNGDEFCEFNLQEDGKDRVLAIVVKMEGSVNPLPTDDVSYCSEEPFSLASVRLISLSFPP